MGEDSIGLEAINKLDKFLAEREYMLCNQKGNNIAVRLYSANQDPILAGAIIAEGQPVLIVDAVDMNLPPGSVQAFTMEEAILNFTRGSISTHGFDLAEILKLTKSLGYSSNVKIIGIQIDKGKITTRNDSNNYGGIMEKIISKIIEEVKQIA